MSTAGPAAPAGWYNDPNIAGQLRYWDGSTWTGHTSPAAAPPPHTGPAGPAFSYAGFPGMARGPEASADTTVRRISDYERWTGWLWLALGIIQILTLVGIIAGAWNIWVGRNRVKMAPQIAARDPRVPGWFEPLGGYIVLGLVNLVLGGVIGVVLVGVDLFVRDQVLKNRHLFATGSAQPAAPAPVPGAAAS